MKINDLISNKVMCRKCGRDKILAGDTQKRWRCRPCESVYRKEHWEKHGKPINEERRAYNKRWREKNVEYKKQKDKEYYWENKDRLLQKSKVYRKEHRTEKQVYDKQYRRENSNKLKKQNRSYYARNKHKWTEYWHNNKEEIERKRKKRGLSRERKDKINKYWRDRQKVDINFKLAVNIRKRLNSAIKGEFKTGSSIGDLGCSIDEFKKYLEIRFVPGMTWDNWSRRGWHIDHIKPLSRFNLSDTKEFKEAVHYTNLQPLWARDNISKGAK